MGVYILSWSKEWGTPTFQLLEILPSLAEPYISTIRSGGPQKKYKQDHIVNIKTFIIITVI